MSEQQPRSAAEIQEHYDIEKQLAARLMQADQETRKTLYTAVYDELFQKVPHHPMLTRKRAYSNQADIANQVRLLRPFLTTQSTFLEIGPGDCSLSFAIAEHVKSVYAVDVCNVITDAAQTPENFQLHISDGISIPTPENSVDFAYSNQLMEHLHPDDAMEQLSNIYKALKPGGLYYCSTPSSFNGPHDISMHFDPISTGLHLKEYSNRELKQIFTQIGFSRSFSLLKLRSHTFKLPTFWVLMLETLLSPWPKSLQKKLAIRFPVRNVLGVNLIGVK